MRKVFAQLFYRMFLILVPAIAFGGMIALVEPWLGFLVGVSLTGIGLSVTAPRPERGER